MKILNDQRTRIYEYEERYACVSRKVQFVFSPEEKKWSLVADQSGYGESILTEILDTLKKLNKDNSE